jgi:hypothetical protein
MKKYFQILLGSLLCLFLFENASAQQFLTPVSTLSGDARAITKDGRTIEGKISTAMLGPKGLISFRIKDEQTGETTRFKAEEIDSLRIKMDGLAKMMTLSDQTSNLRKLSNANFNEINEREYIYYHQVQWPGKSKFRLVQLLNAGWHDQIQVYDSGQKTANTSVGGIAVAGGEAKSYVIRYKGETFLVESKNYQKQHFPALFANCPPLMGLEKSDTRFRFMAEHIFVFTTECN